MSPFRIYKNIINSYSRVTGLVFPNTVAIPILDELCTCLSVPQTKVLSYTLMWQWLDYSWH